MDTEHREAPNTTHAPHAPNTTHAPHALDPHASAAPAPTDTTVPTDATVPDPEDTTVPDPEDTTALGPVEITRDRIREFADAIGDPNPAYRVPAAARALGHPDVIAPPTFAVRLAGQAEANVLRQRRGDAAYDYTAAIHLSQDFRHFRPIRHGDVLTARARILQEQQAMNGSMLSMEVAIATQDGEPVTRSVSRFLSRRPAQDGGRRDDYRQDDCRQDDCRHEAATEGATEAARQAHKALAEFIGGDDFVCLGAKAALKRDTIVHRHCGELGDTAGILNHLEGVQEFLKSFEPGPRSFSSFVATFDGLADTSEEAFERAVWRHLQGMHDRDSVRHGWTVQYDSDPASPYFAFSVSGHPFFVVGLHPGASRPSRRFELPALVFNSHLQFNAMGLRFFKLRKKIRAREQEFHGSMNPSLATYREEARHYSGRMTTPEWTCPFTARTPPGPDSPANGAH